MTLLVGLGNPGPRYAGTRHNLGFRLVDHWAAQGKHQFRWESKFYGEVCRIEQCWLLKPGTFMNRSGQAVSALTHYYKIPIEQILIVHDDLDFPPGVTRLKQGGGDGKHNGLKNVINHLGSNQFLRLRMGIGHPGRTGNVTNYVLSVPSVEEETAINGALKLVLETMPLILSGALNQAMQQLHVSI